MTTPAEALRTLLDGEHAEIRAAVREWLSRPGNAAVADLRREAHRAQVLAWAQELAAEGGSTLGFPVEYGGQGQVGGSVAAFETLAFGDLSLLVKCGVQFGLFGGAVLHLGTARHHERHLRAITAMELPGCFAMTETGHGSNVHALRTTATYDAEAQEFVVHTPDDDARKDYIGNAARDGRMAAVFAQLIVGGEERGVHALLVPLRDASPGDEARAKRWRGPRPRQDRGRWALLPGITIEDCGAKLGLEGVDNGRIAFDHVRVGREALLDRYAQVREDGTYFSSIENPSKRFFVMLGTLIQGRVSICGASISGAKVGLDIAVRRALTRRQFGPPGGEEVLLMDYRTHQRRLLPALATTYGLHFAQEQLVAQLHEVFTAADVGDRKRRELETLAAGLKAVASWHTTETIQSCREACGGAGYLRANRFARRLKGGIDGGREPFDVLVDCQDHVVTAARAWVDHVVLEAFARAVERCEQPELRSVLDRLCSLYALSRVEAERGWYQEHGRLTAARSKAVIKTVNTLCGELREHAELLVDGFGVPAPALADAEPVAQALERVA